MSTAPKGKRGALGPSPALSAALSPPAGNSLQIECIASGCLARLQKQAPIPALCFFPHEELPGSA